MKSNSLFYTNIENRDKIEKLFIALEKYAENGINPVYIINKPLEERKSSYTYEKAVVILIPKHKIIFVNYGNSTQQFEDFCEDFIEDIGQLSKKYDYMKILGRPRQWKQNFTVKCHYEEMENLDDFLDVNRLSTKEDQRKGEFLISLLTGSINDIDRTGADYPDTVLEQIKRKVFVTLCKN